MKRRRWIGVTLAVLLGLGGLWWLLNNSALPPSPAGESVSTSASPENKESIDEKCVVIIAGQRYDVTELRLTHTGGDVFECGEDLTELFQLNHPGEWELLDPFEIRD